MAAITTLVAVGNVQSIMWNVISNVAVSANGPALGSSPSTNITALNAASFQTGAETEALANYLKYKNDYLLPHMNAKQAAVIFDKTESEALAVLDNLIERKVLGLLTESYTLKRYSEELDRRRREVLQRFIEEDHINVGFVVHTRGAEREDLPIGAPAWVAFVIRMPRDVYRRR